jgi:hypothetical protein
MKHWKRPLMQLKMGQLHGKRQVGIAILLTSLFDHLYGKTRFKNLRLWGVLTLEED